MIADFSDACSASLARKFANSCQEIAQQFNYKHWAYLSRSDKYYAASPDAEAVLVEAYRYCREHGCVAEAYCNKSPVGIAQIGRIRQTVGIEAPLQDVCFENVEDAECYLNKVISKANQLDDA